MFYLEVKQQILKMRLLYLKNDTQYPRLALVFLSVNFLSYHVSPTFYIALLAGNNLIAINYFFPLIVLGMSHYLNLFLML